MSFWYNQDKLIDDMKHKYMKNVLNFNQEMVQHRQRRRHTQRQQFQKMAQKSNQQSLNLLIQQNSLYLKKKQHQKNILKDYYQRQIKQKQKKIKIQKLQDKEYYHKQLEHRQYEESRRIIKTYEARPDEHDRRRIKTQTNDKGYKYNNIQQMSKFPESNQKKLQNIEVIKPKAFYHNKKSSQYLNEQKDSLDMLNQQFKSNQRTNRN